MEWQKKLNKIKNKFLYLPAWAVAAVAIISMILGIIIGSRINVKEPAVEFSGTEVTDTSDTAAEAVGVDKTKWSLILVNKQNPIPENYEPNIKYLDNGQGIDERAYYDLLDMMDACKAEGFNALICSSYRTMEKQKELFNNKIEQYISYGYSEEEAEQKAGELVAIPGTSEHQLGLALDIVDDSYQLLDEKQENTLTQKWLMNNSWKYGFILRYPTDKSDITGISYEPWHYRYVGKEDAKKIYDAGICLEEYINN